MCLLCVSVACEQAWSGFSMLAATAQLQHLLAAAARNFDLPSTCWPQPRSFSTCWLPRHVDSAWLQHLLATTAQFQHLLTASVCQSDTASAPAGRLRAVSAPAGCPRHEESAWLQHLLATTAQFQHLLAAAGTASASAGCGGMRVARFQHLLAAVACLCVWCSLSSLCGLCA